MFLFPLSGLQVAALPHVLESYGCPPAPKPILESQPTQLYSLLETIPILTLHVLHTELKPSLLHAICKEPSEPSSDFHVLRPSEVAR